MSEKFGDLEPSDNAKFHDVARMKSHVDCVEPTVETFF